MSLLDSVKFFKVSLEDDETEEIDPHFGVAEAPGQMLLSFGVENLPLYFCIWVRHVLPVLQVNILPSPIVY